MNGELMGAQVTASAVIVYLIQLLKGAKWFPWLDDGAKKVNRFIAIVLAGVGAVGIHTQFDSEAGILTITGLTVAGIVHGAGEWIRAVVFQELIYRGVVDRPK